MRTGKAVAALMVGAIMASCGGSDATNPTPTGPSVAANSNLTFTPNSLTIQAGQTVTWVFGSVDHTVVFNAVAGAPSAIGATHNKNVERTFPTAGTFGYFCTIHAGMAGTIVVQ